MNFRNCEATKTNEASFWSSVTSHIYIVGRMTTSTTGTGFRAFPHAIGQPFEPVGSETLQCRSHRGHLITNPNNYRGKPLKMTIYLYCLIPPKMGNFSDICGNQDCCSGQLQSWSPQVIRTGQRTKSNNNQWASSKHCTIFHGILTTSTNDGLLNCSSPCFTLAIIHLNAYFSSTLQQMSGF